MFLVRRAYIEARRRRVQRFVADAQRSNEIQREVLFRKLRRHAESDFGRRHRFSSIRTLDDFRRQMPITNYEYYREDIERVKQGQITAMFRPGTRLLMFATTTGTTGRSKFIPITQEFFDEYREGWNYWGIQTYSDHVDLSRKKTLQLASNWRQFLTPGGTPCGSISGLAANTAPLLVRPQFVLPAAVSSLDSAPARHYLSLRLALASSRLGMIITANPSTLVELARSANRLSESLVRDIHNGTVSTDVEIPIAIRNQLGRRITQRDPGRARELERMIERHGALRPRDAWPMLSVLAVWMGGSVSVYLPQLKPWYGEPALRDHGLHASEGRMTIPLSDGTTAGIMDYDHQYFEFIPADEHDSADPTVLEGHELQEGSDYFVLLTTSSGLYRYDIHDMVRCVGFTGKAPLLEFLNKGANFSSFTGEKLSEYQVVRAVQRGFGDLARPTEPFTLAPVIDQRLTYVLLLESGSDPASDDRLAKHVDGHLQRLNCEYADKRHSGRLSPVCVQRVPAGTWSARRMQRTSALGNFEQYKHPCLVNDLQFVQNLAQFAAVKSA
jgi:hypothetical protein